MCNKSSLHDMKKILDEENCRMIIRKCYELIFNAVPELLHIAAMCEALKIVFDFNSETVS